MTGGTGPMDQDATRKSAEGSRARDVRRAARERREAGARIVTQAKLHLLAVMRRSGRCAPWRSGRTLKDLERRSGLLAPAGRERAPLLAPLLDLLEADGLVARRAGHYRLTVGRALRCPACGAAESREDPRPTDDDLLDAAGRYVCAACGAWCGILDPTPHSQGPTDP